MQNSSEGKELVIWDVDGTIVEGQGQRLFLDYLRKKGEVGLYVYLRLMVWFVLYKLGLIQDPRKAMSYAFAFLKGRTVSEFEAIAHEFFEKQLLSALYPEAVEMIRQQIREGKEVVLISNSIEPIVKELANYLEIKDYFCTSLEVISGAYTGNVSSMVYGGHKIDAAQKFANDEGYSLANATAYSDHESDQPLLSAVSHPFAVNPTNNLRKVALVNGWPVLSFKSASR